MRLPLWLCHRLYHRARVAAAAREPDFCVMRADTDDAVYLRRWWLVRRNNYLNIYLHQMILDDDAVFHDHPYWSVSLMLHGRLTEFYCKNPPDGPRQYRSVSAGQIVFRSGRFAHQLVIPDHLRGATWTIFITGPRYKEWGFWCPRGWRLWSDYVSTTQDPSVRFGHAKNTSKKGVGCGEMS